MEKIQGQRPYTDAIEWALYRSGEQQPEAEPVLIRFNDLIERGAAALDDAGLAQLHSSRPTSGGYRVTIVF
ncbi:MAG: hypothetical protein H7Z16_08675 [Pyrinomonadaceae bacterium]|nr:hypothetical protein [Pyrinomonadaceae bacterium]